MNKKALCIGNAAYPEESLRNPVNDADALSLKLKALGFECDLQRDATIKDMQTALRQFATNLEDCEVGLFFFAGHGMQIEGDNYLTATDTDFGAEMDAKYSSLPLNKVIEVLEKGANATSIIILDACRNNPYERRWRGVGSRGLAPVYAPKGTIIAFATSPGQVANDGDGGNGSFTAALLKHIGTQNITVEDLFKRVRNTLSAATSAKQVSWEHTSLMGDFFFNPAVVTEDFVAEYSQQARADSGFECVAGRPLSEIIGKLRSHDWYKQNAAVTALGSAALSAATKDELFVLGRNLYQAACGKSNKAEEYLSALALKLGALGPEVAFHVLSGSLYEIYFDSHDRFRERKKTEKLDDTFLLEDAKEFCRSFDFIAQSLIPYQKQLFYVPGTKRDVLVDVVNTRPSKEKSKVLSILFDGQDVFYAADGETLIANTKTKFHLAHTVAEFEEELLDQMATPRRRLHVTYSENTGKETSIVVPCSYRIQRLST
jgi:hypothetical protein